jgi:hypothetical protein
MNPTRQSLPLASVQRGTPTIARPIAIDPQDTFAGNIVRGRVLLSLQEATQPADFDLWRWISVPVWGLVLFFLPLATVIAAWQYAGLLYAIIVGFIFIALLRFIFSGRLMQSWMFISALHGRHVVEPMPLTMLRVRVGHSQEVQLRLKGHLRGGSATMGDRILAQGRWRYNVLHVSRLYCERTGAWTIPIQPCALRSAISGTVILATMGLWLYLFGIPWVQNQVPGFLRHQYQTSSSLIYQPASEENEQIKP